MPDAPLAASSNLLSSHHDQLWSPRDPASSQTDQFRRHINARHSLDLRTYEDLWAWSVSHTGTFWSEVWDWDKGPGQYVDYKATPRDNPRWFEGASLNWAENQLRHARGHLDDIAIVQISEACPGWEPGKKVVSQKELYALVGKAQRAMKREGVVQGDTVAFWGGNCLVSASAFRCLIPHPHTVECVGCVAVTHIES
jgi:acetoacetyl-CoA synthetase